MENLNSNDVFCEKKCKTCGETFEIKVGEKKFYDDHGFELPNRCKSCRDKRKAKSYEKKSQEK